MLTLTGPGGIGKTRLAVEVARTVAPSYADGAFFVGLAAVDDPLAVPAVVVRTLGLSEEPGESPADACSHEVSAIASSLLLLDNFERVIAAAPLVADLIDVCPRLTVLTTSRERLHLTDETERRAVTPRARRSSALPCPRAGGAACTGAPRRARGHSRDLPAAPRACRSRSSWRLLIRLLPLSEILARLEQRLAFLTGGPQDLPARQQTLAATIDWSYAVLDPDEQAALKQLAPSSRVVSPSPPPLRCARRR